MFRIGITQHDTCPSCNEEAESTEHFLCECPAYGRIRHQIFGADALQLRRVASHPLTEILRYVNESGIFRSVRKGGNSSAANYLVYAIWQLAVAVLVNLLYQKFCTQTYPGPDGPPVFKLFA